MGWRRAWLVAAAMVVVTAPAAGAASFKWANDGDARAMDPYTFNETVQNSFLANIYEPLIRRAKDLTLEPGLAVKWESTAPDTWRFHLRQGVKFSDGTPFTADDVIFSFNRIRGKNSAQRSQVATIKEAHKIDDMTVDFVTDGTDPILPQELTGMLIMSKAWCEAHDAVENVVFGKGENYALTHAMGTGPYVLTLREPDRRTVVDRNPGWWGKLDGNVDHAEFDVISNASTRVAALLSGEMDMIYSVPPQDEERLAHTPGIKLIQGPELRTIYLAMDQTRPELLFSNVKGKNPLQDVRVRRAFSLAIDEDAIVKRVMHGEGHVTWLMYGPGVNGYDAVLDHRPPVDLAKAKSLLADAGYPDGFQIQMDCPNDRYVMDEQICTAIAGMLAKVGVKVDVYARTKVKFFSDVSYPNYKLSLSLQGWTPATYDAHNVFYTLLASRDPKTGRGQTNNGGYSNPEIDKLTDEMAHELDPKKRQALIDQAAKIAQDDVATIPLHQQVIVWATRDNVSVVQPADNNFYLRWVTVK
ncbi:MAG TPA: ABC transporter substrate-binding protein [Stellaceae bacterium]|jgi:peptide/nickel transport system substrate-binding protein